MQFTLKSLPGRNEQVFTLFQGDGNPYICGGATGPLINPNLLLDRLKIVCRGHKAIVVHQWYDRHGIQHRNTYLNWEAEKPGNGGFYNDIK